MDKLQIWLPIIGGFGLLSFIGTIWTIIVTRKGQRVSKYIDTVTSSRLRWIEKISQEAAELNALLMDLIFKESQIIHFKDSKVTFDVPAKDADIFTALDNFSAGMSIEGKIYSVQEDIKSIDKTGIIKKINLIKLHLNPFEHNEVMNLLTDLKVFVIKISQTKKSVDNAWTINNDLIIKIQELLKGEWNKIKVEANSRI